MQSWELGYRLRSEQKAKERSRHTEINVTLYDFYIFISMFIQQIFTKCLLGSRDCYTVGSFKWEYTDIAPEQEWHISDLYITFGLQLNFVWPREGIKKWNHSGALEVFGSNNIEFYEQRRPLYLSPLQPCVPLIVSTSLF